MRWLIAQTSRVIRCTSWRCDEVIGAGEAYALVSSGNHPKCPACIKRLFGVDPPDDLWTPREPETDRLPAVVRQSGHGWASARNPAATARDGKLARISEEDR